MGRTPTARSNASSPSWIAGESGAKTPGGAEFSRAQSISALSGTAARKSFSAAAAIASGSCPGASRIVKRACASTISVVFTMSGLPPKMPLTSSDGSAQVRS